MMVSSRTYQKDPVTGTEYSFVFNTSNYNTDMNFYLLYEVRLNSVTYDVYWLSYDDMAEHIAKDPASEASTLVVCQKMFAAMPGMARDAPMSSTRHAATAEAMVIVLRRSRFSRSILAMRRFVSATRSS